jgi:hypothetical protein
VTTSQSDVDKVMAAFGAAPMKYRPNQDTAEQSRASATAETMPADGGGKPVNAASVPSARAAERILPGAGGRVREIFPLLWRAIPVVGELKIGAIKRPGDEIPEPQEPETPVDDLLAARLLAASAGKVPASVPDHPQAPVAAPQDQRVVPFVIAETRAAPHIATDTPAPAFAPAPAKPLPPLRSHAELIRPVPQRAASHQPSVTQRNATQPTQPPQTAPLFVAAALARPMPPQVVPQTPPQMVPQMPWQAYATAAYTPPPPPPQGYPPYYPPQPMPPQGLSSYPMHPAAMHPAAGGWLQPAYPPPYQPAYAPPYPPPGAGYPPGYPYAHPQQPYPPGTYAPGYPQAYGAPSAYEAPPIQAAPYRDPTPLSLQPLAADPPPATAAAPQPPSNLSDIFAALHRAPGTERGGESRP